MRRDVVVTGIGLVSCAGEGVEAHLAAFASGAPPRTDAETFAPYPVHPVVALTLDAQIPRNRTSGRWSRGSGSASTRGPRPRFGGREERRRVQGRAPTRRRGGRGRARLCGRRGDPVGLRDAGDPGAFLNERLLNDLRPTLFLAQLSNLLAGNISIVHGVTGASRTFMGEEACGVDALRIAHARVASGQIDTIMVGSSYNAERPDVMVVHEMGGFLDKPVYRPVFERREDNGGSCWGVPRPSSCWRPPSTPRPAAPARSPG